VRILITGASGFVGSHLGKHLSAEHDVLGVVFRTQRRLPFRYDSADLTAPKAVAALLQTFKPQVIIHAAAMSRVLECEQNPAEAQNVNVTATATLLHWAERLHSKFIFLSSDQVFSGNRGGYRESHDPDPVNIYGRTKLEAERLVLTSTVPNLVVRSNSVVGPSLGWGESFTDMILRKLRAGDAVTLFADQYRSPIHIRMMVRLLEAACVLEFSGLLHAGGPQRINRLDTGYAVARAYGLSPDPIEAAPFASHPHAEIMTADNSYDISRLKQWMPFLDIRSLDEELAEDATQPNR
jgi:dTDP-4-dehydrorhamnose reductase